MVPFSRREIAAPSDDDAIQVARSAIKADRQAGVLRVPAAWAEAGVHHGEAAEAMAGELRALSAWLGVASLVILWGRAPWRTPRATWGMVLAHLGVGVFIVGVTMVRGYETERDLRMSVDEYVDVATEGFEPIGARADVHGIAIALQASRAAAAVAELLRGDERHGADRTVVRGDGSGERKGTETAIRGGLAHASAPGMGADRPAKTGRPPPLRLDRHGRAAHPPPAPSGG